MREFLPESFSVDVGSLSRLFDNTTNSYKLIFFQALLNLTQSEATENRSSVILSLQDLAVEMAAISWYPHTFFKLSFGIQDQMGLTLEKLDFSVDERSIAHASTQSRLRQAIREQYNVIKLEKLLRFVPRRLLSSFFEDQLRGRPDHKKNNLIEELSNDVYTSDNPSIYRFIEAETKIEVHPRWVTYFKNSYPIVKGWVSHHWIDYLQTRNPNTPAIPTKINPPLVRVPLKNQTEYSRAVMDVSPVKCIYSGEILKPDRFALDHFIPWSYVCHDQLWNLVPVLPEANSAKGNRLPAEKYLNCFVRLQNEGLDLSRQVLSERKWSRFTEAFVSDLQVGYEDLIKPEIIKKSYAALLPAIISLATQTGFRGEWAYRG